MKYKWIILALLLSVTVSCAKKGAQVAPPAGLEDAVHNYYAQRGWPANEIVGINVRSYPNDIYLVNVEGSSTDDLDEGNKTLHHGIRLFIAQQGTQAGAQSWQLEKATKPLVKLYGIGDQ